MSETAMQTSDSASLAISCPPELLELVSALVQPIETLQDCGTPGRRIGRRCVVCGGEGLGHDPINHDSECELVPVMRTFAIVE